MLLSHIDVSPPTPHSKSNEKKICLWVRIRVSLDSEIIALSLENKLFAFELLISFLNCTFVSVILW